MEFELWLAFSVASIALQVIPGPSVLLVVSYAISQGRQVAVASAVGVALGDLIAITATLLGLGALVLASATLFTALKWAGAAYLVYLGIKLLRSGSGNALKTGKITGDTSAKGVLRHMAAVTALNPKSIAFFIAFVPQFLRPELPLGPQFLILISTFVGLAAVNAFAWAVLADKLRQRIGNPGTLRWLTRGGGGALVGMGLMTAALRRQA